MGEVLCGRHGPTGTPVVVKFITHAVAGDPSFVEAFHREVCAVAALDHPAIVSVIDHGRTPDDVGLRAGHRGSPYLVMERADGSLADVEAPDWTELQGMLHDVLGGLAHAHAAGIVHCDIKPANLLFVGHGDVRRWLIADFGIAWQHDRDTPTGAGTPSYASPEQLGRKWRELGPGTDLFSLAATVWALLTGAPPHRRPSARDTFKARLAGQLEPFEPVMEVPAGVRAWLTTALSRDPRNRFRCAADALRALSALGGRTSPRAPRKSPPRIYGAGLGLWGIRETRLVGRSVEREQLQSHLHRLVTDGARTTVIVHGEPGMGKTRLARDFTRGASEAGLAGVLWADHDPTGGPGDGIGAMLGRALRVQGRSRRQIQDLLTLSLGRRNVELAAELTDIVRPVSETGDDEGVPRSELRSPREIAAALVKWMRHEDADLPWILVVDDAQWGPLTCEVAEHVLASPDAPPCLLLATWRDSATPCHWEPSSPVDSMQLAALPPDEAADLVAGVLGLRDRESKELIERAGGVPLFAEQLVGGLVSRGVLEPGPHGLQLAQGASIELPASLHELWVEQIDRVLADRPRQDRIAVELAATLGRNVDEQEWRAAMEVVGLTPTPGLLSALHRAGLARPHAAIDGSFSFRHGLLVESLVELSRAAGRSQELNAACAAVITDAVGQQRRRGQHLMEAGQLDVALQTTITAAQDALFLFRYGEAADALADCDALVSALDLPAHDPRRGRVLREWARLQDRRGHLEEAERLLERLLEHATDHDWAELRGWAAFDLACVDCARGRLDAAEARLDIAEVSATHLGDAALTCKVLEGRVVLCSITGRRAEAMDFARRGMDLAARFDRPAVYWQCQHRLGDLLLEEGAIDEAESALERARQGYEEIVHPAGLARVLVALAHVAATRGDMQVARRRFELAAARNLAMGYADGNLVALLGLASVDLVQGQAAAARPRLARAAAGYQTRGRAEMLAYTEVYQAECAQLEGDVAAATQHLQRGSTVLAESGAGALGPAQSAARLARRARADQHWGLCEDAARFVLDQARVLDRPDLAAGLPRIQAAK